MEHQINGELVPQGGGDSIPLIRSPLMVGRLETSDIHLEFPVSRKHCELTFKEGLWIVHRLENKNGVKLNDVLLDPGAKRVVHNGDVLTFGNRRFMIQYHETGRASDFDESGDDLATTFSVPLLEKANLLHPPRHARMPDDED